MCDINKYKMTSTEKFCQILRQRSKEHIAAGQLLFTNGYYGQLISILRQELDSLVRTVFLLSRDINTRQHFTDQTLQNIKWTHPNSRLIVTDRQMVDLTDQLLGWTNSVYKLGCAFIHLSPMADYRNSNPFSQLTQTEADSIKQHLHHYHDFPLSSFLDVSTISSYLLKVLEKVSENLECYISDLESNRVVSPSSI